MEHADTASHLDLDELQKALQELRQGDLLDVAKLPTLYSPESPLYPEEVEGVPHEEPAMTMSQLLPTGLSVVVSQTCDIWRLPDVEPYLLISPLSSASESTYQDAADRLSVRYFAYPEIPGHEDIERPVCDTRAVTSLEKAAILSQHVDRVPCPLSDPDQARLGFWLGQRFGRVAFPTEVTTQIVEPIERALKRCHDGGKDSAFYASVIYYGFRYTPGRAYCSLLLLMDPGKRAQNKVNETEVTNAVNNLNKALTHWARGSAYTISPAAHDVTTVPASELLQHHQLALEIAAADLTPSA